MPPINLLIKPASSLCNMRCKYCFYADVASHRDVGSYGIMDTKLLEELVKKALDEAEGFCGFAFQGGEPTLAGLDFYKTLIELEKKYNKKRLPIHNAIQTNGYVINDDWARFFTDNNFLVGLSLDGNRELHDSMRLDANGNGTYNRVVRAAETFDKYNVQYNILCVVNNLVARHPQKVYNSLRRYGYLQFIPCLDGFDREVRDYSLDPKRYANFLKFTFDNYYSDFRSGHYVSVRNFDNYIMMLSGRPPEACGMTGQCTCYFVVEGDGGVYPCDFYVVDRYRLGSIAENSFAELRESEPARRFVDESKHIDKDCRECEWYPLCRGGCRRNREPFVGGLPAKNIYCEAYREFFDYAYPRLCELARIAARG